MSKNKQLLLLQRIYNWNTGYVHLDINKDGKANIIA